MCEELPTASLDITEVFCIFFAVLTYTLSYSIFKAKTYTWLPNTHTHTHTHTHDHQQLQTNSNWARHISC